MKYGRKRIRVGVLAAVFLSFLGGCSSPREIPDKKLEPLIEDLLLVNAYRNLYLRGREWDTVDIYTPVFVKHGYSVEDFQYTINRMTLRKSARFTQVMNGSIKDLVVEDAANKKYKSALDRMDSIAFSRYRDTLYVRDSLPIEVKRLEDFENLVVKLPFNPGTYELQYAYLVDSSDENSIYNLRYHFLDHNDKRQQITSRSLIKRRPARFDVKLIGSEDSDYDWFEVRLADAPANPKKPNLTIDSVYILHTEPVETVRRRLLEDHLKDSTGRIAFTYELIGKDSTALGFRPIFLPDQPEEPEAPEEDDEVE